MGAIRQPSASYQRFPFDVEFQKALLRLITEDTIFGGSAMQHLKAEHFESQILGWIYNYMQRFHEEHGAVPSLAAVMQSTRALDPTIRQLYESMVEQIRHASLRDHTWLRDAVLDFVKRNVFVRAFQEGRELYNSGKPIEAYDLVQERMEEINQVAWEPIDEEWFYQKLQQRYTERAMHGAEGDAVPTGFPTLDHTLRGGLHIGELGIWMAYPKIGKTTMLVTLGVNATRRHFRVLHVVLEGSRGLVADRYDSAFTTESYHAIKSGQMRPSAYAIALKDYNYYRETLVLRSFVEKWDVNIVDIDQCLKRLEQSHGWRPHLVIIDYADLMTGRDKKYYRNETESQRAAYRDVKRLTNRGYAVWTASQATRPKDQKMDEEHTLLSNKVADTYEKVRAADFLGSLNQTPNERKNLVLRRHDELYRDNAAGSTTYIKCDYSNMQLKEDATLAPQKPADAKPTGPQMGYEEQRKAF